MEKELYRVATESIPGKLEPELIVSCQYLYDWREKYGFLSGIDLQDWFNDVLGDPCPSGYNAFPAKVAVEMVGRGCSSVCWNTGGDVKEFKALEELYALLKKDGDGLPMKMSIEVLQAFLYLPFPEHPYNEKEFVETLDKLRPYLTEEPGLLEAFDKVVKSGGGKRESQVALGWFGAWEKRHIEKFLLNTLSA